MALYKFRIIIIIIISLKIGEYLMKLWHVKLRRTKKCASFLGRPV